MAGLARLDPELDHGTPRPVLAAAATALSDRVPSASDDELLDGVLRIVALVSAAGCDAHTGAYVWGTGTYPVHSLPLRLWLFGDGVHVVDALAPYRDLIGDRIESIDGHPIDDVLAALDPLIPRDNEATVRLLVPRFLLIPEVLRGLGLAGGGPIRLGLSTSGGSSVDADLDPIAMTDYNAWAGPYGLHLPIDPKVPYLSRIGDLLWWEVLPRSSTLFVQENRVEAIPGSQLDALRIALATPGLDRIVLDLRHNYGGEVSAIEPLLALFRDPAVNRADRLFVVTGRNTYSAASIFVARLDAETQAVIVGEPMGGCPTTFDDAGELNLPYSGIGVEISRALVVGISADDPRQTIEPDLPTPLTFDDWKARVDPALDAILGRAP